LIVDECHQYKNYKSLRSKKVKELSKAVKVVWFLTGTPLMNRPQDLYGILEAGHMNALGNWFKFVELFNGYKNGYGGYEFGMPSPEVPERMKRIMLRRLKSEVLKDLPPKTYQRIEVSGLSKELITRLNDFVLASAVREGLIDKDDVTPKLLKDKAMVEELASKLEMTELPAFKEFSEIRALLAEARIPSMLEEVESYEESETPLIVFSAHRLPILELGKRQGWKIITGDVSPEARRDIVHEFQDGKLKGIGLTIAAGGVGITLTHASNVLFVDLDWVPALNLQAEDRCVRIGQTANKVLIKRMSSSHPLDKHMQELIEYKIELAYKALEGSITYTGKANIQLKEETDEELQERIKAAGTSAEHLGKDFYKRKLTGIIDRESQKAKDVPEPKLTTERKQLLRDALEYMSGRCDGAQKRDGQGFNKPDAVLTQWIEYAGLEEDDDVSYRVLERILARYRRQLKDQFAKIWS
jgi:SNF2 family DNA or RNA helicase